MIVIQRICHSERHCHSERSEESHCIVADIPHFIRNHMTVIQSGAKNLIEEYKRFLNSFGMTINNKNIVNSFVKNNLTIKQTSLTFLLFLDFNSMDPKHEPGN